MATDDKKKFNPTVIEQDGLVVAKAISRDIHLKGTITNNVYYLEDKQGNQGIGATWDAAIHDFIDKLGPRVGPARSIVIRVPTHSYITLGTNT